MTLSRLLTVWLIASASAWGYTPTQAQTTQVDNTNNLYELILATNDQSTIQAPETYTFKDAFKECADEECTARVRAELLKALGDTAAYASPTIDEIQRSVYEYVLAEANNVSIAPVTTKRKSDDIRRAFGSAFSFLVNKNRIIDIDNIPLQTPLRTKTAFFWTYMDCMVLRTSENEYMLVVYHIDQHKVKIVMTMENFESEPESKTSKPSKNNPNSILWFGISN